MKTIAYNIDCMEYMKTLPYKAFDLAIVDPPYFKGVGDGNYYGANVSRTGVSRGYKRIECWDSQIPNGIYFKELKRVSSHQIVWGINYYPKYMEGSGRIIWDKKNDTSTFSKAEIAYISKIDTVQMFRYMWNGMLQQNMKNKEKRIHPTQKPVSLLIRILNLISKKGDTILDCFSGSGSTAVACMKSGRGFIGFELDKEYYDKSIERIHSERDLFTF